MAIVIDEIQLCGRRSMVKVITYGTYDMLHYGHIRLLERAKALGDYLIVGVTSSDYDKYRGKVNVEQSLVERIRAVKDTGLADEIIVEEYEGQKINDIIAYGVDIFAIGSDWKGQFDYLNEYCKVVYLDRTKGISSSEIRSKENNVKLGVAGDTRQEEINKFILECSNVNGADFAGVYNSDRKENEKSECLNQKFYDYDSLLKECEAVYLAPHPCQHYEMIKKALLLGKHVLCKSPIALTGDQSRELFQIAKDNNVILMDAIKTAYSTAYNRLRLLVKSGKIGRIVSLDATCTSLADINESADFRNNWNSIESWGTIAMLPVFQLLGTDFSDIRYIRKKSDWRPELDAFLEIIFIYPSAVANIKMGNAVKAEGDLIISGTDGYIYVPAPWWKTDYFEIRYENPSKNIRFFYQLEGEGIRYELVTFLRSIREGKLLSEAHLEKKITEKMSEVIADYKNGKHVIDLI